jgi:ubiquinone/menaquinone biosynthesis C-methylase UbiE
MSEQAAARWVSYDSVADTYVRMAVPWFTPLARDLVEAVSPQRGEAILDVGTGTGLVASLAGPAVAPTGWVIGADPSIRMLGHARQAGVLILVVGKAPGLPFPDGAFDVAVANLVMSHFPDLAAGLADLARVIRPGGRFGATAWAHQLPAGPGNERPEADEIVASVRQALDLDMAPPANCAVPWEDELSSSSRLEAAITGAGLVPVMLDLHRYDRSSSIEEFLSGWGSQGRYIRYVAGESRWAEFVARSASALRDRFGETILCANEAWVVTAQRP